MKNPKEFIVPWLEKAKGYSVEILETVWANPKLGRMVLNENPIPPSEKVVKAAAEMLKLGNRYPSKWVNLKEKIGKMYGVGPEYISLANGSSEILDNMMRIFMKEGEEIIMSFPTFSMFPSRAEINGRKVVSIPLRKEDLQYDVDGMLNAINDKTGIILVINPNNPTGIFIDDDDLIRILKKGLPTCIDEAYLEYHPGKKSKVPLILEYPNAFVMHTLSKAYGLAGLRFGYVVAQPDIVWAFEKMKLPWNLSLPTLAAVNAILDNPDEIKEKVEYNNRWMDIFYAECEQLGLKPFKAHGNYMLIDANKFGHTTKEICKYAQDKFLIVLKEMETIHGQNGYFRVTPGTEEENKRFVEFLRDFFKHPKS